MILDHIALRVANRLATARFFVDGLGYLIADEFDIVHDNGERAKCYALTKKDNPEIFISDGTPGSIVGKWVAEHKGIGGVHHLAWRVDSVPDSMEKWRRYKMAQFTTDKPIECPGLVQIFTTEHPLTGVVFELIQRTDKGFCAQNVKALMESSAPKCPGCNQPVSLCTCHVGE
jgi:4-hydroxyphenylpyruvate dioxygenase-like putative hemolysin